VKCIAEEYNVPIILTWQLNADDKPAYTKAVSDDVDNKIILSQDESLESMFQADVRIPKSRDGLLLKSMIVKWDIKNGDFGELDEGMFRPITWDVPGVGNSHSDYTDGATYEVYDD
jgi:hypothetical protein